MNLTCYVIDDEPHAVNILNSYIQKTPGLLLIGTALSPLIGLQEISAGQAPDLTFLDVDMPELSGLDLAAMINQQTTVIFTTSYREHAPEAFENDAADYLLKPISYERFLRSIQKVKTRLLREKAEKPYFFVKSDMKGKMIRVSFADIRYISSIGNYVEIYLGKEKVIAYLTLSELDDLLPANQFYRIQKSVIVSSLFIQSIEQSQVRLLDQTMLPIGAQYKEAFLKEIRSSLWVSKRER
jgi:two-component system LytT family response regulator